MGHFSEIPLEEAIERKDTLPLPVIKVVYVHSSGLLTLRQVRESCRLNQVQLACDRSSWTGANVVER